MKVCECLESLPEFAEERFAQSASRRVEGTTKLLDATGAVHSVARVEWWVAPRSIWR